MDKRLFIGSKWRTCRASHCSQPCCRLALAFIARQRGYGKRLARAACVGASWRLTARVNRRAKPLGGGSNWQPSSEWLNPVASVSNLDRFSIACTVGADLCVCPGGWAYTAARADTQVCPYAERYRQRSIAFRSA